MRGTEWSVKFYFEMRFSLFFRGFRNSLLFVWQGRIVPMLPSMNWRAYCMFKALKIVQPRYKAWLMASINDLIISFKKTALQIERPT